MDHYERPRPAIAPQSHCVRPCSCILRYSLTRLQPRERLDIPHWGNHIPRFLLNNKQEWSLRRSRRSWDWLTASAARSMGVPESKVASGIGTCYALLACLVSLDLSLSSSAPGCGWLLLARVGSIADAEYHNFAGGCVACHVNHAPSSPLVSHSPSLTTLSCMFRASRSRLSESPCELDAERGPNLKFWVSDPRRKTPWLVCSRYLVAPACRPL